jgi:hypothetical protein
MQDGVRLDLALQYQDRNRPMILVLGYGRAYVLRLGLERSDACDISSNSDEKILDWRTIFLAEDVPLDEDHLSRL